MAPFPSQVPGRAFLEGYWNLLEPAAVFAVTFLVVLLVGLFLAAPTVTRIVRARNRNNPTLVEAIGRYVRVLALIVAIVVAVIAAGFGRLLTSSALVVAAVTLAIGVAGQAVFGNLISGLFLVADPKFNVGDYIVWSGGEGTVESITLRVTRVRTPEYQTITVPNTDLATDVVTQPVGRDRRRVSERFGVEYHDDLGEAMVILRDAARGVESIRENPSPEVYLAEFGPSEVVLEAHVWIDQPRRHDLLRVRSTYRHRVKERLEEAGITLSPASKHELSGGVGVERVGPTDEA